MIIEKKAKKSLITYTYISAAILAVLFVLFKYYRLPFASLGGSIFLLPLVGWLILSSGLVKQIALENSKLALIVTLVIIMNLAGYIEKIDITAFLKYADSLIFFYLIFFYLIVKSVMSPLKSNISLNEIERKIKKDLTMRLLSAFLIIWMIIAVIVSDAELITFAPNSILSHSTILLMLTLLALIGSIVLIARMRDSDIEQIVNETKYHAVSYSPKKIKLLFYLCLLVVIAAGSVLETMRGLWLLWFESVLLLILLIIIHWKIYRHIFQNS